jgi:hypothetical protein
VLSGTSYGPPPPQGLIDLLNDATRKDPLGDSAVWAGIFKDFNKPFGGPTGFEWLSRDAAEVKKYVDDPLCGFAFTNELTRDIFVGFVRMRDPALEARIPRTLPVLVIQGELDPVGENLVGTRRLVTRYQALGLTRIEPRYYPGARHELLNETNRDEVTADVLGWVGKVVRAALRLHHRGEDLLRHDPAPIDLEQIEVVGEEPRWDLALDLDERGGRPGLVDHQDHVIARQTLVLGLRALAHRLEPLLARQHDELAVLLVGERAGVVKHAGQLVGITLVKPVEVGLDGLLDGLAVVAAHWSPP